MISLLESYAVGLGFELATPGRATDHAVETGSLFCISCPFQKKSPNDTYELYETVNVVLTENILSLSEYYCNREQNKLTVFQYC